MNKNRFLKTTALAGMVMLAATPALAASAAADASKVVDKVPTTEASSFYVQQLNEASDLMGQVNLVRRSLDLGLAQDAVYHIDNALKLADTLQQKSPELAVVSTLRFNGKVYTFNNKFKDYLIPAVDDMFTVNDLDVKLKKNPKQDDVDALADGVGRYQLAVDIRNVEGALTTAKDLAQKGDLPKARAALNDIYKGAVESSQVYDDPIWVLEDNLVVANTLIKDRDFDGARFALKKAETELKSIRTVDKYAADSAVLEQMGGEIAQLRTTIREDDPSWLQSAGDRISTWLRDIRDIGHKSAPPPPATKAVN